MWIERNPYQGLFISSIEIDSLKIFFYSKALFVLSDPKVFSNLWMEYSCFPFSLLYVMDLLLSSFIIMVINGGKRRPTLVSVKVDTVWHSRHSKLILRKDKYDFVLSMWVYWRTFPICIRCNNSLVNLSQDHGSNLCKVTHVSWADISFIYSILKNILCAVVTRNFMISKDANLQHSIGNLLF